MLRFIITLLHYAVTSLRPLLAVSSFQLSKVSPRIPFYL